MKIRTRIALALALCLLVAGVVVLVVNEAAIESAIDTDYDEFQAKFIAEMGVSRTQIERYLHEHPEAAIEFDNDAPILSGGRSVNDVFADVQVSAQRNEIARSRWYTALAILVMSVAAGLVGWLIARRVLRPARLISERASAASASDLGRRIALEGPNDEMKELSKTFDDMLDRLERSFEAQRRFAAQVSHELRTPLAVIEAEADLLQLDAGPGVDPTRLRSIERIRAAGSRADHLIGSLLALSRAESGNVVPHPVRVDELVGDVLAEQVRGSEWANVRVDLDLDDAEVVVDPQLLECVVVNLLENAARHGAGDRWVRVAVGTEVGDRTAAVISIENPVLDSDLAVLRNAFRRGHLAAPGTGARGNGIGLTVVALIVEALGGSVEVVEEARGVRLVVRVPSSAAAPGDAPAVGAPAPTTLGATRIT
ncbi:MAG: HAMP domain-containing sensor histidine kinase [Acidimicrobiia bacterium]